MNKLFTIFLFAITCTLTTQIKAQEITYRSGFFNMKYYQNNARISKQELISILEKDDEAIGLWKKSKVFSTLGTVSLAAEFGFAIATFKRMKYKENSNVPFVGTLCSFAAVIIFETLDIRMKKKAINQYNNNQNNKTTFGIKPSKDAIGIAFYF